MSVAGIPSFLEERLVLFRERRNGLYTPLPFVVANTMATIPFLFVCSLVYAVLIYWSVGLHGDASYFFRFLAFLFLGVYAAETQSLLIAAILPIFVAALAVAAFANGFWMAVQGYFMRNLPDFWYYWAHFIGESSTFRRRQPAAISDPQRLCRLPDFRVSDPRQDSEGSSSWPLFPSTTR